MSATEHDNGTACARVTEGLGVLHLFGEAGHEPEALVQVVKEAMEDGTQVLTISTLGHRGSVAVMALDQDILKLRRLQRRLAAAGMTFTDSFFSLTEVSEYARGLPEERKRPRLYPVLPPEGRLAWCFYPMAKRRGESANWYQLEYAERERLMYEHGSSGRLFADRITQLITGATGVSDWEWGVTLFGKHPDDIKAVVYTMRFDEASARYADFGPFYTGVVQEPEEVFGSMRG